MVALKNRTISNEDAKEFIGKLVTFFDGENDYEGEITTINTDGTFRVDTGDQEWDLNRDEFDFIEADEDEIVSEEPEQKDTTDDEEEKEEEEGEKEWVTATPNELSADTINAMDLSELKSVIKEKNIKGVPLAFYRNAEKLKSVIIKELGLTGEKKTISKTNEEEDKKIPAKKETKEKEVSKKTIRKTITENIPKEKKVKQRKSRKPKENSATNLSMNAIIKALRESFKTKTELTTIGMEFATPGTTGIMIYFVLRFAQLLDILEEKDEKFKINL